MINAQQEFTRMFNERMLKFQQETPYAEPLPADFLLWRDVALEYVSIHKSGIKAETFRTLCTKIDGFSIWEVGTMVDAIRQKGRHDLEMHVNEYCDMHVALEGMSAYIDSVVKPKSDDLRESIRREIEVLQKLEQEEQQRKNGKPQAAVESKDSFSDKLKKGLADKNKTIPLNPPIAEA